jgi:hypothetical protein
VHASKTKIINIKYGSTCYLGALHDTANISKQQGAARSLEILVTIVDEAGHTTWLPMQYPVPL